MELNVSRKEEDVRKKTAAYNQSYQTYQDTKEEVEAKKQRIIALRNQISQAKQELDDKLARQIKIKETINSETQTPSLE
jgi:FMN phosphatase YigB (HAD superfamily)